MERTFSENDINNLIDIIADELAGINSYDCINDCYLLFALEDILQQVQDEREESWTYSLYRNLFVLTLW